MRILVATDRFPELSETFVTAEIELLIPLVVRERLIGIALLGEKATGEEFTEEDLETLSALSRHIAVGIHSHHLLEEVKRKAVENQRLPRSRNSRPALTIGSPP